MILLLEKKDGLLYLFASLAETEANIEAIDVENGEYDFCDDTGQRLIAEITMPTGRFSRFSAGSFRLKPDGLPDKAVVISFLEKTLSLDRGCNCVTNIEELKRHVGIN